VTARFPTLRDKVEFLKRAAAYQQGAWHIGDPQFPDAQPWIERTESLLADALRYAREAIGLEEPAAASVSDRRPPMKQRRERRTRDHAAHGFGEQWGHMQFR
jgi:hypothetical protein